MKRDKILVTGGSGFLGTEICRLANERFIKVISLSKSGKPDSLQQQYASVTWLSADIFDIESWKAYLKQCYAVIHCIGILEEHIERGITYEKMILGSAMLTGDEAKDSGIKKFVYVSAGAAAPGTPEGYMKNKRAAEQYLTSLNIDLTILRPGMIYGPQRPETISENEAIQKLLHDPDVYPGLKENRPLPVSTVAGCALKVATGQLRKRVLSVDDMDELNLTLG